MGNGLLFKYLGEKSGRCWPDGNFFGVNIPTTKKAVCLLIIQKNTSWRFWNACGNIYDERNQRTILYVDRKKMKKVEQMI